MPTYPYRCETCKAEFEREQKITDAPVTECQTPGCEGRPKRQIGTTSFVLNGDGWYRDGYAGRRS